MTHDVSVRQLNDTSKRPERSKTAVPGITSIRLHLICIVQALLAASVFTVTEHDDHRHDLWFTIEMVMQSVFVVAAAAFVRTRVNRVSGIVLPILILVVLWSFIWEPIQRVFLQAGLPFEMLVMHSQCNLMLALAVCGFRPTYQRLSIILSVFIVIFCCTVSNAGGLIPFVAAYSLAAVVWLVAAWWENVNRRVLDETRRGMPKLQMVAVAGIPVLLLVAVGGAGANRTTNALQGWLPGSGGSGDYDPFARGGVNDGDALVAGNQNIKSFGPIENSPFVEDDQPSLYDVFNDTFDEPAKPVKKRNRAIALPSELMKHIHRQLSEARQTGREFSLIRGQEKGTDSKARDLNAHALFHVAGRTPLHLRLEVCDLFDGFDWLASEKKPAAEKPGMRTIGERTWLSVPVAGVGYEFFSDNETHAVKTSGLKGSVIPTPPHIAGVHIPHIDRLDFYEVDSTGIVSLSVESIPPMTPINLVSQLVDRQAVATGQISIPDLPQNLMTALPVGEDMQRIRELAARLTAGKPRGWQQIAAIEQYLKGHFTLDREANASPDTESPVEEFLFETKRGPEYLFASSAAVMLRSLRYPARLVSGFYAKPEKYDQQRHHTPVHAADAHVWCEVGLGASTWLTIEPSPGYELLAPPPGYWEQFVEGLNALWRSAVRNAVFLSILAVALFVAFLKRRTLENALRTLEWKLAASESRRARAARLARLIDHRLRLAGLPRQSGTTLKRWAGQPELTPVRDELSRIADLADQATFDSGHEDLSIEPGELNHLAATLSYEQFKRLHQSSASMAG